MELYNNNSSYLQDFSNPKPERVIKKRKGIGTEPASPDADLFSGVVQNDDSTQTENVAKEVKTQHSEDSTSPDNSQPKQSESCNDGMNFANRYK